MRQTHVMGNERCHHTLNFAELCPDRNPMIFVQRRVHHHTSALGSGRKYDNEHCNDEVHALHLHHGKHRPQAFHGARVPRHALLSRYGEVQPGNGGSYVSKVKAGQDVISGKGNVNSRKK